VVQIQLPRPNFRISNLQGGKVQRAPNAKPGDRWFKSIYPDYSFACQISAVRCVVNCDFNYICTDNKDKIGILPKRLRSREGFANAQSGMVFCPLHPARQVATATVSARSVGSNAVKDAELTVEV
jgi:hypothetical protein